jgi:hypothetical protein
MSVRLEMRVSSLLRLPGPLLRQLVDSLVGLAGIGLAGIGASGVVAYGLGVAFGKTFVAGDPAGVTYTPARCRDFFEYAPHARNCEQAAVIHHYGEIVGYRLAAGLVGLVALGALWVIRRRAGVGRDLLPDGFAATIGLSLTGIAAALLLASGFAAVAFEHGHGAGGALSGGIVSLALSCWFAASLHRVLRARST